MANTQRSVLGDLVREVNRHAGEEHAGETCQFEGDEHQIRVYYIYSSQDRDRVPFVAYVKQIENCRNLCDIRATYAYRKNQKLVDGDVVIVTPSDDTSLRVE